MKTRLVALATLSMLVVGMITVAPAEARWRNNNNGNSCGSNNGYNQGNGNGNGFFNRRSNRGQMKKHWRNRHNQRGWFNNNNNNNQSGLNTQIRLLVVPVMKSTRRKQQEHDQ